MLTLLPDYFYNREVLEMLKGDPTYHSGSTSAQQMDLPASYASDTRKFLDDSSSSLDNHSNSFVEKVDEMMKEIDEQTAIWKGKLTEMKKQAEHIASQRRKVAGQLQEFSKKL